MKGDSLMLLLVLLLLLRGGAPTTVALVHSRNLQQTTTTGGCDATEYSLYRCTNPVQNSYEVPCDASTCLFDLKALSANGPPGFCRFIQYDTTIAQYPDELKPCVLWDVVFGKTTAATTTVPTVAPVTKATATIIPTLSIVDRIDTTSNNTTNSTAAPLPPQATVDFGTILLHTVFDYNIQDDIQRNLENMQDELETLSVPFLERKLLDVLFQFSNDITVQLQLSPIETIVTKKKQTIVVSWTLTGRATFQAEYAPRPVAVRDIVTSWISSSDFRLHWKTNTKYATIVQTLASIQTGRVEFGDTTVAPTRSPTMPTVSDLPKSSSSEEEKAPVWQFWEHIEFWDWSNYYWIGAVTLAGCFLIMVFGFMMICYCRRRKRHRQLEKLALDVARVLTEENDENNSDFPDLENAKVSMCADDGIYSSNDENSRCESSTQPESTLPSTFVGEPRPPSPTNSSVYSYTEERHKLEDLQSDDDDNMDGGYSMDFGANVSGIVLPQPDLDESVDPPPSEPSNLPPEPVVEDEIASLADNSIPIMAVDLSRESDQKGTVLVYDDQDDCSLSTTSDSMMGDYDPESSPVKQFTSKPPNKVLSRYPLPSSIADSAAVNNNKKSFGPLPELPAPTNKKSVLNRYPLPPALLQPGKEVTAPPSPPKSPTKSSMSPGKKSSVLAAVALFEANMNKNKPWIKDDETIEEATEEEEEKKPVAVTPDSRKSTETTSSATAPESTVVVPTPKKLVADEVEAADLTMPTPDTADIATPKKGGSGGPPKRDLSSPKKLSARMAKLQIKSIFRSTDKTARAAASPPHHAPVSKFTAVVETPKNNSAPVSNSEPVADKPKKTKETVVIIDRSEVGKENGLFGRRSHSESPSKRPPKPSLMLKTGMATVPEKPTARRDRRSQSVAPSTRFEGTIQAGIDVMDGSLETSLTWASTAGFSLLSGRSSKASKASQTLLGEENEFGTPTTLPVTPQTPTEYSESETSDIQSICSKEFTFKSKRDYLADQTLGTSPLTGLRRSQLGVSSDNGNTQGDGSTQGDGIRLPAAYR